MRDVDVDVSERPKPVTHAHFDSSARVRQPGSGGTYAKLGGVLPPHFENSLIVPRNQATNRGNPLTESESSAAVESALSGIGAEPG